MKKINYIGVIVFAILVSTLIVACSSSEDDGSGEVRCDLVASTNQNPDTFFKVINRLNGGLSWHFSDGIPFGADMKPNECVIFGLNPGGYSVTFQQCNIADEACASLFGSTKEVVFSVERTKTHTVEVRSEFFS